MPFRDDHGLGSDTMLIFSIFCWVTLITFFLAYYFFGPNFGNALLALISMASGGIASGLMAYRLIKKEKSREARARAERTANQETEVQKQISAMKINRFNNG